MADVVVWTHAVADVDGDGDRDVVVGGAGSLVVLRNEGGQTFGRVAIPNNTDWVFGLCLFDADGDGDQDLYVARGGYDSFYLNDGAGNFSLTSGRVPSVFDSSRAVIARDVDGDHDLDLIVTNVVTSSYVPGNRLYLNDGTGRFVDASVRLPSSPSSLTVVAGDLDGDSDVDLIFGNDGSDSLFLNDGAGNFTAAPSVPWDSIKTVGTALADFDGDGDLDLVAAIEVGGMVRLFLNDGAAHFSDGGSGRFPGLPYGNLTFTAGDIDRDGDVDLVFGNGPIVPSMVLRNDGLGFFTDVTTAWLDMAGAPVAVRDLWLVDFDGDGDLDLWQAGDYPQPTFLVSANDGARRFVDALRTFVPYDPWNGGGLAFGDLDGDHRLDVVVSGCNVLLLQRSDGTFVNRSRAALSGLVSTHDVAIGDVDRDGDLDLVYGSFILDTKRLLLNDGTGRFTDVSATHLPSAADATTAVAMVDTDGDDDLDLVCAVTLGQQSRHYRNDGTGHFTDVTALTLPAFLTHFVAVAAADVDHDGDVDLVFASEANPPETVRLYLNDGSGQFTDATAARLPGALYLANDLHLADVDGDGFADLLVGHSAGVALHRNDGTGRFVNVTATHLPPSTRSQRVAVGDIDADGDLDLLCSMLLLNDGTGHFTDVTTRLAQVPSGRFGLADLDGDGDADVLAAAAPDLLLNCWHQTRIPELAGVGRTLTLDLYAEPGVATAAVPVAPFLATRLLAVPLDLPTLGRLWLDASTVVSLPVQSVVPPSGQTSLVLPVPPVNALAGLIVDAQAVVLHGTTPATWHLTNATAVPIIR